MTLLHWSTDLDTGFEDIDLQHRQLVNYINNLDDAAKDGDRTLVAEVLQQLIDYTVEHFTYEEQMLERAGYPLLEPHKRVHQHFVDKVVTFQGRFNNGDNIAQELLDMLEGWLFMHIKRNDHGYVEAVKKSGITAA